VRYERDWEPKPHSGSTADYWPKTEARIRAAQERHEAWLEARREAKREQEAGRGL
jgi:hypothetical protein